MLNPISSYCNVHNPGLFCPVKKSFERGYTHEGLRFRAFRSSDRADRHAVHKVQACEQGGNPDRIVLSNPGTITLGKKQMLRGGKSRPRNKVILNMLNYIGVGERAGSGVPNIYAIWEQEGYVEPTVDEMSGRDDTIITVVTLPLVKKEQSLEISEKQPEKSPEKQPEETRSAKIEMRVAAVLDLIRNDPTLSRVAIARKLEITDSQARTAIDKLKERGKIHHEGSDTDGKWIID